MDIERKLEILANGARYDLSCTCGHSPYRQRSPLERWIYPAALPNGRSAPILKILLSNVCEKDCSYCENRRGRDFRRVSFTPEELASHFMALHRSGAVVGLFLSSAISGSSPAAMDKMIATAEILRSRHGYRGYLHLKILPGAEEAQVEMAGKLATRVSINIEVPSRKYLGVIAPGKRPEDLLQPLSWIKKYLQQPGSSGHWAPSGFTVQFMVGAAGESDREIIQSASALYRKFGARRIYYSAFQPIEETPLENATACPLWREQRLYQCDFLIRKYGFEEDDLVFDETGNLVRDEDPKEAWAKRHPEVFPLEINTAPPQLLARIPGIGPKTVRRIIAARRSSKIRSGEHLRRCGVITSRAAPFILLDGRRLQVQTQLPF